MGTVIQTIWFDQENVAYGYPLDVWSYGCLMWYVAMRRQMFLHMRLEEIKEVITSGRTDCLPADFPDHYQELYQQCMDVEPDARPSLSTIIGVLEKCDDGFSVASTRLSNIDRG